MKYSILIVVAGVKVNRQRGVVRQILAKKLPYW
jgi:hypothetical protein